MEQIAPPEMIVLLVKRTEKKYIDQIITLNKKEASLLQARILLSELDNQLRVRLWVILLFFAILNVIQKGIQILGEVENILPNFLLVLTSIQKLGKKPRDNNAIALYPLGHSSSYTLKSSFSGVNLANHLGSLFL